MFINRELDELRRQGFKVSLLIINPFNKKEESVPLSHVFSPGLNPLQWIFSPILNRVFYKRSVLITKTDFRIFKATESEKIDGLRFFGAAFFLESAFNKLLRSKVKFDHIHSHHLFSASVFTPHISKLLDLPYSISLHTLSHYFNTGSLEQCLKKARFLRGVTSETTTYYNHLIQEQKVKYIANGIEDEIFEQAMPVIANEKLTILAIGYFFDKKGFDVLIKACKILKSKNMEFKCTIIGKGPEKNKLIQLIKNSYLEEEVQLLPFLNFGELIPYFKRSTLLAVPCRDPERSTRDGLPTVILEAMALGLPVVASDFAGISDAVIHRKTGLLTAPNDDEMLAEAMVTMQGEKELRTELILNAKNLVRENFSLQKNIHKLASLFSQSI